MIGRQNGRWHTPQQASRLVWLGRALLLVPEAVLIVVLTCLYLASSEQVLFGIPIACFIITFIVRTAALHLARRALEQARYREASALSQVALILYPWSADTLALQGTLALATGAPELAEVRLRRAIALLPGQPFFYGALSGALLELGRPVEAITAANQALMLDRNCTVAYLNLAEAERAIGAPPQLIEERLRAGLAVARLPSAEAVLRCVLAGHLLAEQRIAEASLALHGAEALLSRCSPACQSELRLRLGELLAAQGQLDRAREHFRSVEALDRHGRLAAAAWRAQRL